VTISGILWIAVIAYPLIYVLSSSLSDPIAVMTGRVWLLPIDPTLAGYRAVFQNDQIWLGYYNSIIYTVVGTAINVSATIMAAYPLSRRDLVGAGVIMFLITFTMFFQGGLVPTYLVVRALGLINTRWALWLPAAIQVWHVIIARTFFRVTLPKELLESAQMDGCSNTRYMLQVVLPLSKAIVAVLALFYAVNHWNQYFPALLYLRDQSLYPLQIILRRILTVYNDSGADDLMQSDLGSMARREFLQALLRYAVIIVATVPVLAIYPFVQKYFVKGIMIGSLKG
jgi:ABC-type glycerol-3-phosphate transport system permease component